MIEILPAKKNKVLLSDYDYKQDIENRLLLSSFTALDYIVLEEILYSPIRLPLHQLSESTGIPEEELLPVLQKIAQTNLLSLVGQEVVVDKEVRKYFETEAERFEENFCPGMEFLQHLLKKVPIHALPQWYAISKTSDNIFASIIEKYLVSPQVFQRYLLDLHFPNPAFSAIAQDVLKAPRFEISAEEAKTKYNLTPHQFQEAILHLEFHFVCTTVYRKKEDLWEEKITLFQEWKEYLSFLKETAPIPLNAQEIQKTHSQDFPFIENMDALLLNLPVRFPDPDHLERKIQELGLRLKSAADWHTFSLEDKASHLYRRQSKIQEKTLREMEKALCRVLHLGWIYLADFLKGLHVPISDGQAVTLRKNGKQWKYQRPTYSPEDLHLLQTLLSEHFFESGIIALGTKNGEPCFSVTPFGQAFLG